MEQVVLRVDMATCHIKFSKIVNMVLEPALLVLKELMPTPTEQIEAKQSLKIFKIMKNKNKVSIKYQALAQLESVKLELQEKLDQAIRPHRDVTEEGIVSKTSSQVVEQMVEKTEGGQGGKPKRE